VFPREVVDLVREPTDERQRDVHALRRGLERFPFHAAVKTALGLRGVPVRPDVRAPLRPLTSSERSELDRWLESS
jgi:dihydrodipicolinate synthase/N-acetylneuraminate lyase